MSKPPAKHLHLLPLLSFLPLIIALIAVTHYHVSLDPLLVGAVAITYVAVNIIYRSLHGTLRIGYIIEYALIALIVFFVLSEYV